MSKIKLIITVILAGLLLSACIAKDITITQGASNVVDFEKDGNVRPKGSDTVLKSNLNYR